jgi:hypothetical protein
MKANQTASVNGSSYSVVVRHTNHVWLTVVLIRKKTAH